MTIVTPIDGQPALAEHIAQLTESLTGVRAEPITLRGNLLVNGATYDLGATAARWRKLWAADGEFTNAPTVGGVALPTFTTADARYLRLTGGTVTGSLIEESAAAGTVVHWARVTGDTQPRLGIQANGTLNWGAGGAATMDASLSRFAANDLRVDSAFIPTTSNARDLGTTALKWRSAYLGTVLSVAGASATADQITHAITTDAQPRLIVDGNGQMKWGPGASTAQDTFLSRSKTGSLQLTSNASNQGAVIDLRLPGSSTGARLANYYNNPQAWFSANCWYDLTGPGWTLDDTSKGGSAFELGTPGSTVMFNLVYMAAGANPADGRRANLFRVDTSGNVGIPNVPAAWGSGYRALQVGQGGAVWSAAAGFGTGLTDNTYFDGTNYRAIAAGLASRVFQSGGQVDIATAPSVGAGATQTFSPRLSVAPSGQMTLTPAASTAAIVIGSTAQPKITVAASAPSSPMTGDVWFW